MFSDAQKLIAWRHANAVEGYDPNHVRKDVCGAWIVWGKYGHDDSPFGWEIDHVFPQKSGGDDREINIIALQHANNASKGDDYPTFRAVITSQNTMNIEKHALMVVPKELQYELKKIYPNA